MKRKLFYILQFSLQTMSCNKQCSLYKYVWSLLTRNGVCIVVWQTGHLRSVLLESDSARTHHSFDTEAQF